MLYRICDPGVGAGPRRSPVSQPCVKCHSRPTCPAGCKQVVCLAILPPSPVILGAKGSPRSMDRFEGHYSGAGPPKADGGEWLVPPVCPVRGRGREGIFLLHLYNHFPLHTPVSRQCVFNYTLGRKRTSKHLFWCFSLSQIGVSFQYLEGPQ